MAIGPVQRIALGFNHPDFHGEVIADREWPARTIWWAPSVYQDGDGGLEVEHLSNLTENEAIKIGTLIVLGFEGEEGIEVGAIADAEKAASEGGVHTLTDGPWRLLPVPWLHASPCWTQTSFRSSLRESDGWRARPVENH